MYLMTILFRIKNIFCLTGITLFYAIVSLFLTDPASPYEMKAKVNIPNVAQSTLFVLSPLVPCIPRSGFLCRGWQNARHLYVFGVRWCTNNVTEFHMSQNCPFKLFFIIIPYVLLKPVLLGNPGNFSIFWTLVSQQSCLW